MTEPAGICDHGGSGEDEMLTMDSNEGGHVIRLDHSFLTRVV